MHLQKTQKKQGPWFFVEGKSPHNELQEVGLDGALGPFQLWFYEKKLNKL